MRLEELTAGLAAIEPSQTAGGEVQISGLAYDSRRVRPGHLFFCVPGFRSDGHEFAGQAVASGAAALVVERPLHLGVPEVRVADARAAMGPLAARFFGDPTARLRVIGITGTNGKTTTAYLVRALLEACGVSCGLLGTVSSVIGGRERAVTRTTPEAIDLQADFAAMLAEGDGACAMEVSSHALSLGRISGVSFAAAVFTNISRDHLDFHGTMEDYFQAKRQLFLPPADAAVRAPQVSVVNLDDPYGRRLAGELDRPRTFALDAQADYRAEQVSCDLAGCRFALHTPGGRSEVRSPLPGRFNVANALGALAAVHTLEGKLDALGRALERGVVVPGRLQRLDEGQEFAVLIDYAHTPDSLENVLRTARELTAGRVLCVFGAGGDRDRGKRPLMGAAAARLADEVIVTSDNPRSEDPEAIIAQVMAGIDSAGARVEPDRASAIALAMELAERGDVVLIAGKGHEQGQELADRTIPFDDATVARRALRAALTRA